MMNHRFFRKRFISFIRGISMAMNNKLRDENLDFLFRGILQLQTMEECYNFFEDLCTVSEIKAMSQRAVVAKMLRDGHVYSDIVARTGASTATISRVNRSLNYGCDGYDLIFQRIDAESETSAAGSSDTEDTDAQ